jgi:hypothetical protein
VRRVSLSQSFGVILGVATVLGPTRSPCQAPAPAAMSHDEIVAFAKVEVAISKARDSAQAEMAQAKNTKPETQRQVQDKLKLQVSDILHHAGLSEADFQRKTYIVSTDSAARRTFDVAIATLTGVPTPGQVMAAAAPAAVKVPAGMVGTHIGHVVNGFNDTPNGQGLLPVALAEARTAAQHAALAARAPGNLDQMKLHAGHVINAVDPAIMPTGPGLGYGVKKAAEGIAMHIDLAAKAPGASPNVIMHANHVATSARNTVQRCDQVVAVAKQVQAATSAAEAATLVNQLVSLTAQLTAGFDANGDGKITWQEGEGGLQQVQEHMNLMLAGEGLGARH